VVLVVVVTGVVVVEETAPQSAQHVGLALTVPPCAVHSSAERLMLHFAPLHAVARRGARDGGFLAAGPGAPVTHGPNFGLRHATAPSLPHVERAAQRTTAPHTLLGDEPTRGVRDAAHIVAMVRGALARAFPGDRGLGGATLGLAVVLRGDANGRRQQAPRRRPRPAILDSAYMFDLLRLIGMPHRKRNRVVRTSPRTVNLRAESWYVRDRSSRGGD
jgi:hypothetical protein